MFMGAQKTEHKNAGSRRAVRNVTDQIILRVLANVKTALHKVLLVPAWFFILVPNL